MVDLAAGAGFPEQALEARARREPGSLTGTLHMLHPFRFSLCLGLATPMGACLSNGATQSRASDDGGAPSPGTVAITRDGGVPISPFAFGQSYWDWADWAHDGVTGLTGTEPLVTALHVNVIRAGGNNNDSNVPRFDTSQIDKFVAYCRAVGAEPILQVPLVANNVDGGVSTPQTAADMVSYANGTKGYGIKYWEIGNEPDLYATVQPAGFPIGTAAEYCAEFAAYVTAMKAANAGVSDGGGPLQFLGPELSQPNIAWLTPFLDGCKDYVDIVTVHRYPFGGAQTSPSGALNDVTSFRSALSSVASVVQAHARPNTPLGITESNLSYDYALRTYTQASLQAAPGTFYAALWAADVMGAALENRLWTLALWNIGERSRSDSVLGFITGGRPVPAYYSEWMVSANFHGSALKPVGAPAGFSVYASYDAGQASTAVLVLNKTPASTKLTLAVDAQPPQSFDFPALSVTLVQIPDSTDAATHVLRYTADLAAANMAPQAIQ
jgi:hypothetical protein